MPRPALFLDRDGVINVDHGYVHRVDAFEFVPGIFELVRFAARDLGWPVVVITNQSGIGRGYYGETDFEALTRWMLERFAAEGAPVARVYHCPFHPDHGIGEYRRDHPWRKPQPGMILQAATDLDIDLPASVLIGDKEDDMQAATAAGIACRLRLDPSGTQPVDGTYRAVRDLTEALGLLRAKSKPSPP